MATFFGFSTRGRNQKNNNITDVDLIKEDLRNHFFTRRGSRLMMPNYGTVIWDMLFEPFTDYAKELIEEDVKRIVTYDPRTQLMSFNLRERDFGLEFDIELYFVQTQTVESLTFRFDRNSAERIT